MPRNVYFSQGNNAEQILFEDIQIEALKIYGQETYYLPRKIVTRDMILNEDRESQFDDAYMIEMYIEDIEGFGGEGNLMSKFGIEIRDEVTFVVARRTWNKLVGIWNNTVDNFRPNEGDLIYLPLSNSLFEISFVEHEQPFYQIQNLPVYKLQARLFEYNDEDLRTGIADIDKIETIHADILSMLVRDISGDFKLGKRYYQCFPTQSYRDALQRKIDLPGLITAKEAEVTAKESEITDKETEIDAIDSDISSLNAQIESLQSQIASTPPSAPQYPSLISQLSLLQSQLDLLTSQRYTLTGELTTLQNELLLLQGELGVIQAEFAVIDTTIEDERNALPFVSGILTEQDLIGGTTTNRTVFFADIETNSSTFKQFYVSTNGDIHTYIMDDIEGNNTISAEIYEIYGLDDNTNRTFENDAGAQNWDFENTADDIIDFSESNPFGEPS